MRVNQEPHPQSLQKFGSCVFLLPLPDYGLEVSGAKGDAFRRNDSVT